MLTFILGFTVGLVAGLLIARSNKSKVDSAVSAVKEKAAEIKSKN